jgi:hypothetical protein
LLQITILSSIFVGHPPNIETIVTAAASQPSSSTSIKVFYIIESTAKIFPRVLEQSI